MTAHTVQPDKEIAMALKSLVIMVLVSALCVFHVRCVSVPHMIWPQDDIRGGELNDPDMDQRILVASRRSEYKEALVQRIRGAFTGSDVYVKFTGLGELKNENGREYDAVIMINTCMSWDMDRNVKGFLERYEDRSHMIVLTTSGGGDWQPDEEGRDYDAISAASEKANLDDVAHEIVAKAEKLLGK
jgi:hypothetical protein